MVVLSFRENLIFYDIQSVFMCPEVGISDDCLFVFFSHIDVQHSKSNKPENKEKGFKRSRNLERQRNQDKPVSAAPSYKPFDDHKSGLRSANEQASSPGVDSPKKSLYDR